MNLLRATLIVSALVLTIVLCGCLPHPRQRIFRLLGIITVLALAVEVAGTLTSLQHLRNTILYNIFSAVEFILVLLMVRARMPIWNWALGLGAIIGLVALGWSATFNDPRAVLLVEGILMVAMVSTFFLLAVLWQLARTSLQPLHRVPVFWLFMGLLLYFGGLVPVVGLSHFVLAVDGSLANRLWSIVPVLCILRYLLAAVACYLEGSAAKWK